MSVAAGQTAPPHSHGTVENRDVLVVERIMLTISTAIDEYHDDLVRRKYSPQTLRLYMKRLEDLCDFLPRNTDVSKVTTDDLSLFLGQSSHLSANSQATYEAAIVAFFKWLRFTRRITSNPCDQLVRTRRPRPETLDVTTVSTDGVRLMLAHADGWPEKICISILAFMGPRRHATAMLRLRDYDRMRRQIKFREKGGKTTWKRVPDDLDALLEQAITAGVYKSPDDYLVPPRGQLLSKGERSDQVIWQIVRDVAKKAGISARPHALRASLACFWLEQHPGDIEALKEMLGHKNLATTEVYLRRFNRDAAMDRFSSFSWGVSLTGNAPPPDSPQFASKSLTSLSDDAAAERLHRFPLSPLGEQDSGNPRDGQA